MFLLLRRRDVLLLILLVLLLPDLTRGLSVKLVEGVDRDHSTSNAAAAAATASSPDDEPTEHPPAGPPHLAMLVGRCFTLQKQKFEYDFCPFANVTQRRVVSGSGGGTLLGVWEGVYYNSPSAGHPLIQEYNHGAACREGHSFRSVIEFSCFDEDAESSLDDEDEGDWQGGSGGAFELASVASFEPVANARANVDECLFRFVFTTPFPCSLLAVGDSGSRHPQMSASPAVSVNTNANIGMDGNAELEGDTVVKALSARSDSVGGTGQVSNGTSSLDTTVISSNNIKVSISVVLSDNTIANTNANANANANANGGAAADGKGAAPAESGSEDATRESLRETLALVLEKIGSMEQRLERSSASVRKIERWIDT